MKRIASIVVLAVALTGCGSTGDEAASPSPSSSASSAAQTQQSEAWENVPAKNRKAFLAVLGRADPGLIEGDNQRKRGLRRAVYTCRDIEKDGLKGTKLAIYISQRFTGGHGDVSIAEGRQLAAAIQQYICPSL